MLRTSNCLFLQIDVLVKRGLTDRAGQPDKVWEDV